MFEVDLLIFFLSVISGCFLLSLGRIYVKKYKQKVFLSHKRLKKAKEICYEIQRNLSNKEIKNGSIADLDALQLMEKIKEKEIKIEDVISYFQYKAYKLHLKTNCISRVIDIKPKEIVKSLENKDISSSLLYGLPVSLKENIATKGMDTPRGISILIGNKSEEDSVVVKVLKYHGAIPFVKTTVPYMCSSLESFNPIYGRTKNPLNPNLSPGGSSSGEGALIGGRASLLGFGTDIAGSIRTPANFCGISGFKPTSGRVSSLGLPSSLPWQRILFCSVGPMARDVDTLVQGMRALLSPIAFELDKTLPALKFNEKMYQSKKKLRIGFYLDDGYQKPVPAIKRAVKNTKNLLEKAGHQLVQFNVPRPEEMQLTIFAGIFADKGDMWRTMSELDGEPQPLKTIYELLKVTSLMSNIKSFYHKLKGNKRLSKLYKLTNTTASQLSKYHLILESIRNEFFHKWNELNLDVLICPAFCTPACPANTMNEPYAFWSYPVIYNMLNYPAGVVTVSSVSEQDIKELEDYEGHYNDNYDIMIQNAARASLGMPISIQCVSLPWKEELCLKLMKEVETVVSNQ